MKKTIVLCFSMAILMLSGCDDVKNDEREKPKETSTILKPVLLLDFADQNCPYCPRASEEAATLKKRYGDSLVVVTIHAYPSNLPLVTEAGNEYDRHFEVQKIGHPVGIIDGIFTPEYYDWEGTIIKRIDIAPSVHISLQATYNNDSRVVSLVSRLKGLRKIENTKLLLWVVENNIIDFQKLLNGSVDSQYQHQHILRKTINGTWGEAISLEANEEKTVKNEFTLDEKWKPADISVVAFVYDVATDDVLDVAEVGINGRLR
jgi:thiol-disulfide isomerase/thioredoxin